MKNPRGGGRAAGTPAPATPAAMASPAVLAAVGWLLPGGGYLLLRRYRQFALYLLVVSAATLAGVLLGGANLWPAPVDLRGLEGLAALMARGGALAKAMAGGPYLLARLLGYAQSYPAGCLHEYGTALLTVAGLLNLLALADAWEMRGAAAKEARRA
jgi:hypothetical protein